MAISELSHLTWGCSRPILDYRRVQHIKTAPKISTIFRIRIDMSYLGLIYTIVYYCIYYSTYRCFKGVFELHGPAGSQGLHQVVANSEEIHGLPRWFPIKIDKNHGNP